MGAARVTVYRNDNDDDRDDATEWVCDGRRRLDERDARAHTELKTQRETNTATNVLTPHADHRVECSRSRLVVSLPPHRRRRRRAHSTATKLLLNTIHCGAAAQRAPLIHELYGFV